MGCFELRVYRDGVQWFQLLVAQTEGQQEELTRDTA